MSPLRRWMTLLLRFVAIFNVLAGLSMLIFYHESYKVLGVEKPELTLPLQLVGILVGLFGVGYWMVASNPVENRNVLLLGFLSKAFGSMLGIYFVVIGKLPPVFLGLLFFSDIVYLPPFAVILRVLYREAAARSTQAGA